MLLALMIAGGASRPDVLGQVIVRVVAWLVTIIAIAFLPRPNLKSLAPVVLLLLAVAVLLVIQLIPLPPSIWVNLSGRELLAESASLFERPQPWRPISLSPSATVNSLSSLIVPAIVLLLIASLKPEDGRRVLPILLCLVIASSLVGFLQFSGTGFDNPFVNDMPGAVSGTFANRNHFALLLACGCLFALAWAFSSSRSPKWQAAAALGLLVVFALMILGTGSRMGLLLGSVATVLGVLAVWGRFKTRIQRLPKRVWIPAVFTSATFLILAIVVAVAVGRAQSIDRVIALDASEDLRTAALPTLLQMVKAYWPLGSGVGAFDPVYRIHEPADLLSIAYLNHAHNDWLEFILDGGLPALLIIIGAISWWFCKSVKVWKRPFDSNSVLPRVGSSMLFLIALASLVDYPARTPMVMGLVMIAAVWLNSAGKSPHR